MKIKVTPHFNRQMLRAQIEKQLERVLQAILNRFELVGFEFVKMAREKTAAQGGFNDVTGNLRSSIGFAVVDHGEIVSSNLELSNTGSDRRTGRSKAERYLAELSQKFPNGIALVVVAGMDYAAAVESRGKDVITGSSLEAEATLKKAIANIQRNLKTKK